MTVIVLRAPAPLAFGYPSAVGSKVSYESEFAVLWDVYSMDNKAPKGDDQPGVWSHLIGVFEDGRSTDEILAEIRPVRGWDELS